MNDKVNIELCVPEIGEKYNILLPINKKIGTIVKLLDKAVNELSQGDFRLTNTCKLYNADTFQIYEANVILFKTDIRNGTKLILLSKDMQ